jgi:hypothetical protein
MTYRPLRTAWFVSTLVIVAILAGLCEMASGNSFRFPELLWWIPAVFLYAIGLSVAGALIARFNRWRQGRGQTQPRE